MIFKNSLSTVLYIVLGIILAFGLNQGLAFALSTSLPIVAVESNSMIPTFQRGDILILQGTPSEDLKIGDIIVFSPEGHDTPIVHRIIKLNEDGTFQTKGDANARQLSFETRIQPEQIYGKEVLIVPYLGWIKISFSEFILPNMISVAAGIILIYALYIVVYKADRQKKHK
jgi:signal peptidase